MRLTKQQFINRFTEAEMQAILTAAKASVAVDAWLFRFDNITPEPDGTAIDLGEPGVIYGISQLEAAGLLASGRGVEILGSSVVVDGVPTPTITLTDGQPCFREPEWKVVAGGIYPINQPVEVQSSDGRSCAYQAQYIATGEFA